MDIFPNRHKEHIPNSHHAVDICPSRLKERYLNRHHGHFSEQTKRTLSKQTPWTFFRADTKIIFQADTTDIFSSRHKRQYPNRYHRHLPEQTCTRDTVLADTMDKKRTLEIVRADTLSFMCFTRFNTNGKKDCQNAPGG
jgi:hypothetical protein